MNPARPLFARRQRNLRYCDPSWGGAKASRNTSLRNGDKRRSHLRALVPIEARRRLLTSPELICAPKGTNSSAVKSAYSKSPTTAPSARSSHAPVRMRSLTWPSAQRRPILFGHRSSAALHSITSSARARSIGGTARPSVLAVCALMTSSNLVGCSTGRSAGFAPRRILSTKSAARRKWSGKLGA